MTLTLNPAAIVRARLDSRRLVAAYETTLTAREQAWDRARIEMLSPAARLIREGMWDLTRDVATRAARAEVLEAVAVLEEKSGAAALAAWPNDTNDHGHAARLLRLIAASDRAAPGVDLAMIAWSEGAAPDAVTLWESIAHTDDPAERAQIFLELGELASVQEQYGTAYGILRDYVRELLAPALYRAELQAERSHERRIVLAERLGLVWVVALALLVYRGPRELVNPVIIAGPLVFLAVRFDLYGRAWRAWLPLAAPIKAGLAVGSCAYAVWSWTANPATWMQAVVFGVVFDAFLLHCLFRYLRSRKAR